MMEDREIEARLRAIEKHLRIHRSVAVLACAAALALGLMAAKGERKLVTESVTIVGKTGKSLAILGASPEGSPVLTLYGSEGKATVTLGISGAEGTLAFRDGSGKVRTALGVFETGSPHIALSGSESSVIALGFPEPAQPLVWMKSAMGEEVVRIPMK